MAKGIGLLDKKPFLFIQGNLQVGRAFESNIPLMGILWRLNESFFAQVSWVQCLLLGSYTVNKYGDRQAKGQNVDCLVVLINQ